MSHGVRRQPPETLVVVVGGGFAGLSAAARLAAHGVHVIVLEAKSRLGGRATSFRDRDTGVVVDNGQHVLLGCYGDTFAFLETIGARDRVRLAPSLGVTMIDEQGRRTRLACPPLPSPFHALAGVFDWDALDWRDRLSFLKMGAPLRLAQRELRRGSSLRAASPGETVERWLVRHGQTHRLRELLWHPLALAALNQPADAAAAPVFARVLAEMLSGGPEAAAIALPVEPLTEMYAEPARTFVNAHGGIVRTGAPARVDIRDQMATVAVEDEQWTPDAVIVAAPWFAWPTLFTGDTTALAPILDRAQATTASPIVSVNLWYDGPVMEEPFVGLPRRRLQWIFRRDEAGGGTGAVSLVSSGASDLVECTNAELVALADAEVRAALPEARGLTLGGASVVREPRATFSLAPGQPDRPGTRSPVRGLYLAGDWVATGLPATIEGAVRSGHAAADAVLSDCAAEARVS